MLNKYARSWASLNKFPRLSLALADLATTQAEYMAGLQKLSQVVERVEISQRTLIQRLLSLIS